MTNEEYSLESLVAAFLADLAHTNHSLQTLRTYAADLAQLSVFHRGSVQTVTAEVLRAFFGRHASLRPATRVRKRSAVACFLTWSEQHDLLEAKPMRKIDRVKLDPPQPCGVERDQIERILKEIPASHLRDRLFFRMLAETGLQVSEELSLYVEDLDLSFDNEHLTVVGIGNKRRTILLGDTRRAASLPGSTLAQRTTKVKPAWFWRTNNEPHLFRQVLKIVCLKSDCFFPSHHHAHRLWYSYHYYLFSSATISQKYGKGNRNCLSFYIS